MARLLIATDRLPRSGYSGGLWCVFQYARGLVARGHEVCVAPVLPGPTPDWWDPAVGIVSANGWGHPTNGRARPAGKAHGLRATARGAACAITRRVCASLHRFAPYGVQRGFSLDYCAGIDHPCDALLATSFTTALPVARWSAARKFYLAQHFEPLFAQDLPDPWLAAREAEASYHLGLALIANSSWLKAKLEEEMGGAGVALCPPGIDHNLFTGEPRRMPSTGPIKVVSYGGRGVRWKGFAEMAEGIQIARSRISRPIHWRVYGSSALPPDNTIATFEPLGFLSGAALRDAYREADILLSASWYESFPLFPIEAMACGIPVITTVAGTEDFVIPSETAEVVPARSPEAIAAALVRLAADPDRALAIARRGQAASREFTWDRAVDRMEAVLFGRAGSGESKDGCRTAD